MKKILTKRFISCLAKGLFSIAMLFAISPCAGPMYEPKLPEKLLR